MRWLIAAHEKEIPGFAGFRIGDWQPHAVGVGHFAALARLSALLTGERPEAIVLAGTAGATEPENVGKIFAVQHFAYPSITGEDLPEFLPRAFITAAALQTLQLAPATVLQNHGVSTDRTKYLSNTGYIPDSFPGPRLENMEATALAGLALTLQIPFTAIAAVTNTIGPNARNEWLKNHGKAGARLADTLPGLLRDP